MNLGQVAGRVGRDELADARRCDVLSALIGPFGALKQRHPKCLRVVLKLAGRGMGSHLFQRLQRKQPLLRIPLHELDQRREELVKVADRDITWIST